MFNSGKDGGFVIISGDDALPDVLGYSDNGRFATTNLPPALQVWLKDCSEAAKYAGEHHLPKHQPAKTRGSGKSVGPLITTKWGQDAPYNNGYPQVNGINCATGCVATAMAQIINYHKHPNGMTAEIPGYITKTYAIEMPTLPPTTFDWGNMLDSYKGYSTNAQKAAVSKLMIYYSSSHSIKECNDEIAHGDADKGCDEARQLEGVVDHIFANAGGACAVKADGCHLCGIVRQEEIAVQRGKHHQ